MALDLSLLEKVRHHSSGKVTSRCPACAEAGGDRAGNHLVIFPDDRFACAACSGDGEHRKRIMALTGLRGDGDFRSVPELREQRRGRIELERQKKHHARCMEDSAQMYRREITERFAWTRADAWDDSPQRIDCDRVESDPAHFLASLYQPDDVLWTGEVHHSGSEQHADRWRSCQDWQSGTGHRIRPMCPISPIGPMTTPAVWKPGIHSRAAEHVLTTPYTVLDFDGFDGIKPANAEELIRHLHDSLALIHWLRMDMGWSLAAILWTGGKSLHAWLRTPPPEVLASLLPVAKSLGMDAGLIGRPEHPCRLPGQRHAGSGMKSRVLWLDVAR